MATRTPFKLDQLGSVGRGRSRHRPRNDPSLYGGDIPFFQTGDVKAAELYLHDYTQTYNDKGLAQSKLWQPGTICITIAANIAESAVLTIPGCFPDSVVGFIPYPDKSDGAFIKYYIDTLKLQMQSASRGTTQDNLSLDKLLTFDFLVPEVGEQRRIASILSAYDDLIENNTRRIAILEEMARRIYEEWFVRFCFPGHEQVTMVESELGLIPEGWVAAKLGSLIEFKKGKKPALVSNQWSDGLMPHLLIDSLRGADRSEFVTSEKMIATTQNDTIMVMDGSGSCDVFIGYEGVIGSTLGRYRVSELSKLSPYWLYLFFVSHLDEIKAKNIGAAIPHANKDFINGMTVPLPMHEVSNRFDQTISPIFELVRVMKRKNKNLRATRDLLLPKLISGELDVSTLPEPEEAIAA